MVAHLGHAIANAVDLQIAREPGRDADDHIGQEGPREPMERLAGIALVDAGHCERPVLLLDHDVGRKGARESPFRPLHDSLMPSQLDLYAGRHGDWRPADTGHTSPPTRRNRSLRRRAPADTPCGPSSRLVVSR